jgi:hypothetical protein
MNWKLLLFFIVILFALLYVVLFWENRHEKIHFHIFNQKTDMNLGLLMAAVFLDGIIITLILTWLLGYFG